MDKLTSNAEGLAEAGLQRWTQQVFQLRHCLPKKRGKEQAVCLIFTETFHSFQFSKYNVLPAFTRGTKDQK
eukprot:1160493-Pelagomonas_calceolata.AAC.6